MDEAAKAALEAAVDDSPFSSGLAAGVAAGIMMKIAGNGASEVKVGKVGEVSR